MMKTETVWVNPEAFHFNWESEAHYTVETPTHIPGLTLGPFERAEGDEWFILPIPTSKEYGGLTRKEIAIMAAQKYARENPHAPIRVRRHSWE